MTPKTARTVMLIVQWIIVTAAVLGVGVGVYAVSEDLSDRTDEWDGLGAIFGAVVGGYSLVVLVLAILCLVFLRDRLRLAAAWGIATAVVGLVPLLLLSLISSLSLAFAVPYVVLLVASMTCRTPKPPAAVGDAATGWGTR